MSDFVQSCLKLSTNVEFTHLAEYKELCPLGVSSYFVVLLGTHDELRSEAVRNLPFYCFEVDEAIKRVKKGEIYGVLSESTFKAVNKSFVRVIVGEVPSEASRNNCPARPDAIAKLLSAALKELDESKEPVDVFVLSDMAVAVAVAVARSAGCHFTAKNRSYENDYSGKAAKINVIFLKEPTVPLCELAVIATSTQLCQRLVDAPTNLLDTTAFKEIAQGYAKALGCDIDVICGDELYKRGYNGVYSVGKSGSQPPCLVTLSYKPKACAKARVALVGKGIVYDCGGLALKAANMMLGMKRDMGGAAAVFCGFLTAVRLQQPVELTCTLCLAENSVGPNAYRNDDIIVMKSGKTVEVINTDAEGRLVLGDGVFHATNELPFKPDILVDMATLTGAQGIATGRKHAALYVSDEEVELAFLRAGKESGETCFPVLYCPEYHTPEFKTTVADMRNLMRVTNNAGVSCGGQFVASHLSPDFKGVHVHVDLAFPVVEDETATGFGPALLTEFFRKL